LLFVRRVRPQDRMTHGPFELGFRNFRNQTTQRSPISLSYDGRDEINIPMAFITTSVVNCEHRMLPLWTSFYRNNNQYNITVGTYAHRTRGMCTFVTTTVLANFVIIWNDSIGSRSRATSREYVTRTKSIAFFYYVLKSRNATKSKNSIIHSDSYRVFPCFPIKLY